MMGAIAALTRGCERRAATLDVLLTARRVRRYAITFLGIALLTLAATIGFGTPPRDAFGHPVLPDYLNHWTGGRLLLDGEGKRLYDAAAQWAVQDRLFGEHDFLAWYVAPPFVALFYLPFAALPYLPSALLWIAVTVALLAGAARLLRPLAPGLSRERWGLALLVGAASQPVFELVGSGQDSALSLLIWVAGMRLALARRDGLAGAVFALGLLKPQLFFVPPLLFFCLRRPRALLAWGATAGLLGGLSLLLVGPVGVRAWLTLPFSPLYREVGQGVQVWKMQTLHALFATVAPAQFAGIAKAVAAALALLIVAGFARRALRHGRAASPAAGRERETALWGFALMTTLLASPHLFVYDLVLLFPPAVLLLARRDERRVRLALLVVFLLTWTLAVRHLVAAQLPWPLGVLGASWTALSLLPLWFAFARLVDEAIVAEPASGVTAALPPRLEAA